MNLKYEPSRNRFTLLIPRLESQDEDEPEEEEEEEEERRSREYFSELGGVCTRVLTKPVTVCTTENPNQSTALKSNLVVKGAQFSI